MRLAIATSIRTSILVLIMMLSGCVSYNVTPEEQIRINREGIKDAMESIRSLPPAERAEMFRAFAEAEAKCRSLESGAEEIEKLRQKNNELTDSYSALMRDYRDCREGRGCK